VKELIESGEIGEPHFAKANYWESGSRYTLRITDAAQLVNTAI